MILTIAKRVCRICEKKKSIDNYEESKMHKDGLRTECRECRQRMARKKRREYYRKNKEVELAKKKKYDQKNKTAIRQYQAEYRAKKREEK